MYPPDPSVVVTLEFEVRVLGRRPCSEYTDGQDVEADDEAPCKEGIYAPCSSWLVLFLSLLTELCGEWNLLTVSDELYLLVLDHEDETFGGNKEY